MPTPPRPPRRPPSWPPWFGAVPESPPDPGPGPREARRLHTPAPRSSRLRRTAAVIVALASLVVLAATVRAALFATAEGDTTVATGTLLLALTEDGAGLDVPIEGLAPGDTVDRFVDLTNTGTLSAGDLTIAIDATGDATLVDDGAGAATTRALTLAIDGCATAWDTDASSCTPGTTSLLDATTIGMLRDTPAALALTLDAGDVAHLRLRIVLPEQDETSVNGVLPSPTVQGATADVTVTFRVEQRDVTSTSS